MNDRSLLQIADALRAAASLLADLRAGKQPDLKTCDATLVEVQAASERLNDYAEMELLRASRPDYTHEASLRSSDLKE
jgi:acyl-CoA reductase-like NAD-dependent aldehyde dehydrogenase